MKVLITGGAGYLGSVLTHQLLVKGYDVTVVDNFMYRQQSLSHLCMYDSLRIIRRDVCDPSIYDLLPEHDVVIPLAAIVGAPACVQRRDTWEINCRAVIGLVNNVSEEQLVIYPNTNSGYGKGGKLQCTEDSPLDPISEYGRSKVRAEHAVLSLENGVSLRFATLFGCSPRMRLDLMVNDFVYRAVRDRSLVIFEPEFRRNFLHVRDAAVAIEHTIRQRTTMRGRAFNVGDSRANMTKRDLALRIGTWIAGGINLYFSDQAKDPDQRDYVVSNDRMEATGWNPLYSIDDGIAELIKCFAMPFEEHRNV